MTLVTEADQRAEELIVGLLRQSFPDHLFYTEEGRGRLSAREVMDNWVWFVDPLDGTTNFVYGVAFYSVSLCLFDRGIPLVGVVYDPSADELFSAALDQGARLNGRPIQVSSCNKLQNALLSTGFAYDLTANDNTDHVARLAGRIRDLRRMGSAALDLSYVACGRFDGYWEYGLEPWDHTAGTLILREAGGTVTNLIGSPMRYDYRGIAASNGLIHAELLANLAEGRTGLDESD